jgi:hypothetical protein
MAFFNECSTLKEQSGDAAMKALAEPLGRRSAIWAGHHVVHAECHGQARQCRRRRDRLHHLFGLVALGYMWCRIAAAAQAARATDTSGRMDAKLVTARFFMERMLPETATRLARIQAGAAAVMELPAEAF